MIIKTIGQHNYRNLLNYKIYTNRFKKIKVINDFSTIPDIAVFSAVMDLGPSYEEVKMLKRLNKDIKLVLLSEEPLWDLCFGNKITKKIIYHPKLGRVNQINYFTSQIFNFKKIPYFLTSNPRLILNYKLFYRKNNFENLKQRKKNKQLIYAFCERRKQGSWAPKDNSQLEQMKLSSIRTEIIENFIKIDNIYIEGKGWKNSLNRQDLYDWHLDKLSKINKSYLFGFASENSDVENYITEKFFDAIFSGSIPLIVCGNKKNISFFNKVFNINLHMINPVEAINNFDLDNFNVEEFIYHSNELFNDISNKDYMFEEIDLRIDKLETAFEKILNK